MSCTISIILCPVARVPAHNNLDAARLFLALTVAVGHGVHFWFGLDFRYGSAVAMFLGISGYLVLESRYRSVSAAHFLWKRFLRIYPLLTLAVLIGALWLHRPVLRVVFWLVTAGLRGDPMLGPAWTIVVEEVMYGVLLVFFALQIYTRAWASAALCAVAIVLLFGVYFSVSPEIQRILVLPANFFFGNWLYLRRDALARAYRILTWPCAIFGFGYMLTSFPIALSPFAELALQTAAGLVGTFACIGLGLHARPIFGWLRQTVGDLSYGVYLMHSLLLGWFLAHPLSSPALTFTAFLGGSVLLACVSWWTIERPALSYRDVWVRRRPELPVFVERAPYQ
jgi:peptidoglycan/LPS O-acetylase OafA/YrhL